MDQDQIIDEGSSEVMQVEESTNENMTDKVVSSIEYQVSSNIKKALAGALMTLLSVNPIWSSSGELIVNGMEMDGTSIAKLIEHAVSTDSHQGDKLEGVREFYDVLKSRNIPLLFIRNPIGKKMMSDKNGKRKRKLDKDSKGQEQEQEGMSGKKEKTQYKWTTIEEANGV